MIQVYFWPYRSTKIVGHAALRISVGQGNGLDTYVSWWPSPDGSGPVAPNSYETDVSWEGPPKGIVSISGLDEAAMRRTWQTMLARDPKYNVLRKNCAWAVKTILDAGTGYDFVAAIADLGNLNLAPQSVWTPRKVFDYAGIVKMRFQRKDPSTGPFKDASHRSSHLRLS
ncbi:hypothetical protein [Allorhizobium taibaishanense]|uniref:DUF4105 domain-containing protein n=1 Tax=Allorhizobium taibaishanense TaxID=887144 RepID=A0A1Q9AAG5_9HYPH|nr:hypothetical protein [Allorhizobium taibaishanense]MBB4007005.1 hypothetical protein [Allorhizobium taibaishanense]OLP51822.1 hypothetical protein BJF91_23070 [Allorhizobium taibaishanense]